MLIKEVAAEVQYFFPMIKPLSTEIDKKDSNWLVIQNILNKTTNYYEQEEEEEYDAVDGIGDILKFIQKKVGSFSLGNIHKRNL